jgi:hypothetical protein
MGTGIQGVLAASTIISSVVDTNNLVTIYSVTDKGHGTQFLFGELIFIAGVRFVGETSKDMIFKLRNKILNKYQILFTICGG